jgi:hypothetical protein
MILLNEAVLTSPPFLTASVKNSSYGGNVPKDSDIMVSLMFLFQSLCQFLIILRYRAHPHDLYLENDNRHLPGTP